MQVNYTCVILKHCIDILLNDFKNERLELEKNIAKICKYKKKIILPR